MCNHLKIIFICLLFALPNYPQNNLLPFEIQQSINMIDEEEFSSALTKLKIIRNNFPSRLSLIDFLIIKCYYELQMYEEVKNASNDFLRSYLESKYADNIYKFLINALIKQNEFEKAFDASINFIKHTNSITQKIEIKSFVESLITNKISLNYLKSFYEKEDSKFVQPFILFLIAKGYYNISEIDSSQKYVNLIINFYKDTDEYFLAIDLNNKFEKKSISENKINIGVMFPLSKNDGSQDIIIKQILDGIKYTLHNFNKNQNNKIGLVIADTKNDPNEITKLMQSFNNDKTIKCIIGPIYSSECLEVIKNIKSTDLVFISPTANYEKLTDGNDQFYQANVTFDLHGKGSAQFAYFVESRTRFAVLMSTEGYSNIMGNSFIDEINKFGGEIVLNETFNEVSTGIDSVLLKLKNIKNQIDGIYIPISKGTDANIILTALQKLNLTIPIYGTQDWLAISGLESKKEFNNLIRVSSDFYIDYQTQKFIELEKNYLSILGYEPTRYSFYGYDLANHLLKILTTPIKTRNDIKSKLNSRIKTNGINNNILFGHKRRNTYLNILKYSDKTFTLIERFRVNE